MLVKRSVRVWYVLSIICGCICVGGLANSGVDYLCESQPGLRLESGYVFLVVCFPDLREKGCISGNSWNTLLITSVCTEIFLPSYADYHFDDLECRQDPVQDIILTDEEVKNMFPS